MRNSGSYASSSQGEGYNLTWFQENHPDWILYDCDKKTPSLQYAYKAVSVDFTNDEVVQHMFQRAAQASGHADAVSWDNFALGNAYPTPAGGWGNFCGVWAKNGTWVQLFAGKDSYDTVDDPRFTDGESTALSPLPLIFSYKSEKSLCGAGKIKYAAKMRDLLHALPKPLKLIVNSGMQELSHDPVRQAAFIDSVDGILDEGGYGGMDLTTARGLWLDQQKFIQATQAAGKAYYSINSVAHFGTEQHGLSFAIASYLMSKGHTAAVFYGTNEKTQWFPEYQIPIGTPCGAMTTRGDNAYTRVHSGGVSVINADTNHTVSVALPAGQYTWTDMFGTAVQSPVAMAPLSGRVFLRAPSDAKLC